MNKIVYESWLLIQVLQCKSIQKKFQEQSQQNKELRNLSRTIQLFVGSQSKIHWSVSREVWKTYLNQNNKQKCLGGEKTSIRGDVQ